MIKFAIVTTQRTGTTFFRTCLESHPQIRCPGTIFPIVSKFKYFSADRPDSIYRKYRSSSLKRRFAHWFQRKKLIFDCIDDFYIHQDNVKAIGFKASYNQLERYPEVVDWLKKNNVRIVHKIRNNLLKRFLSAATSKERRIHHSTQPVVPVKVHVDIKELKKDLTRRGRFVEKYRKTFIENPYLEVSYELFIANRNAETRRVLEFLDINTFMPLESDLVKLNPDSLRDIIENYEQVVRELKGTAFEKYLAM